MWLNWDSFFCEPLLCAFSLHYLSLDKFFEGVPKSKLSPLFQFVLEKVITVLSAWNDSTFQLGPKYNFQVYCIHLALWILPAIWFQLFMMFIEDAFYESRISDGCWTHPCQVWAIQNAFEAFFSQVKGFTSVPKMLCSKGKQLQDLLGTIFRIVDSYASFTDDSWFSNHDVLANSPRTDEGRAEDFELPFWYQD